MRKGDLDQNKDAPESKTAVIYHVIRNPKMRKFPGEIRRGKGDEWGEKRGDEDERWGEDFDEEVQKSAGKRDWSPRWPTKRTNQSADTHETKSRNVPHKEI